ncbi:putative potassium channel [Ostreococcus tauri]|uniref:Putative potassium channel n=1 Tax=Ostreococcus tauri TaxID=70448 RepID=A0A1Y5IME8_OSTTA|nr:putative potassium channel [Ostreococcus tauri]
MSAPKRPGRRPEEPGTYGTMARDEESGLGTAWKTNDPPAAPPAKPKRAERASGRTKRPPPPSGTPRKRPWKIAMEFLYNNLWIVYVVYVVGSLSILHGLKDEPDFDNFLDAWYFVAITVTTVGYGDKSPKTDDGKIAVMIFIVTGVAVAGIFMSKVTDWILEAQERALHAMTARKEAEMSIDMAKIKANVGASVDESEIQAARERKKQEARRRKVSLSPRMRAVLMVVGVIFIGAVAMHMIEDITFLDGCYWSIVTSTTVGYGDITPKTEAGKAFASAYALITIGVMAWAIGQIVSGTVEGKAEQDSHVNNFKLTPQWLAEQGGDKGYVDKFDFARAMLIAVGKLEASDFDSVAARFKELDVNGDGSLDAKDLMGE